MSVSSQRFKTRSGHARWPFWTGLVPVDKCRSGNSSPILSINTAHLLTAPPTPQPRHDEDDAHATSPRGNLVLIMRQCVHSTCTLVIFVLHVCVRMCVSGYPKWNSKAAAHHCCGQHTDLMAWVSAWHQCPQHGCCSEAGSRAWEWWACAYVCVLILVQKMHLAVTLQSWLCELLQPIACVQIQERLTNVNTALIWVIFQVTWWY